MEIMLQNKDENNICCIVCPIKVPKCIQLMYPNCGIVSRHQSVIKQKPQILQHWLFFGVYEVDNEVNSDDADS